MTLLWSCLVLFAIFSPLSLVAWLLRRRRERKRAELLLIRDIVRSDMNRIQRRIGL